MILDMKMYETSQKTFEIKIGHFDINTEFEREKEKISPRIGILESEV